MADDKTKILRIVTEPRRTKKFYNAWDVTPKDLKSAIKEAQDGKPERFYEILLHLKTLDGHLGGELGTRKEAILGYEFEIQGDTDQQKQFIQEAVSLIDYYALVETILDSGYEGFKVIEPEFEIVNSKIYPVHFDALDNSLFKSADHKDVQKKSRRKLLDVLQYKNEENKYVSLSEAPPGKLIVADFSVQSYKNLPVNFLRFGYGTACMFLSLVKHYNIQDWSAFNEKFAQAFVEGIYDDGADKDAIAALEECVHGMSTDSSGVHPRSTEIKIVEAQKYGSINSYESLFDRANREQSKIILGIADMSELGSVGAKASKETQNKIRVDKIVGDVRYVETIFKKQFIDPLLRYNFGTPDPTVKLKIKVNLPVDLLAEIQIEREAYEMGTPIPVSHLQKKYNIPKPVDNEEVLKKSAGTFSSLLGS